MLAGIKKPLNLVSVIFAQLYFPVLSNRLKEIARWLGAEWSDTTCSGLDCVVQRCDWQEDRSALIRNKLVIYNAEDCLALQLVADEVTARLCESRDSSAQSSDKIVKTDSLKRDLPHHLGRIKFVVTAEHAIKALAALRRAIGGKSKEGGTDDYLILLSICETCKCYGVRFLDFLRSGEKDVHAFAENPRGRRRRPLVLRGRQGGRSVRASRGAGDGDL